MRENEGFDILHNGMPRTFRDQKAMAYEAARFAKARPADVIEIVDRSNGTMMFMLEHGRAGSREPIRPCLLHRGRNEC